MADSQVSLRGLLSQAAGFLSRFPLQGSDSKSGNDAVSHPYDPFSGAPSCPIDGPVSCHNNTPVAGDSCCYIYPSGRMLLAQFWDREVHPGGTDEDWTLHGLWPDLCDGSYKAYCGMTPHFNNISDILEFYGQGDLVDSMNRYWVAAYGSNEHLWAHEYNKHASCINTLSPSCYSSSSSSDLTFSSDEPSYDPGVEVVDYFARAYSVFSSLDSYGALERAGITPSRDQPYALSDVQDAMEKGNGGGKVVLRCNGSGRSVLHEAWYGFFVRGSLQGGQFLPADDYGAHGDKGNCAEQVWYLPKVCRRRGGCPGPDGTLMEEGEDEGEFEGEDLGVEL